MRYFHAGLLAVVLLASGCTGSGQTAFEEGSTYSYSVESVADTGVNGSYSLTFLGEEDGIMDFRVEATVQETALNGSMSLNRSSLRFVEKDPMVDGVIFDYYSVYASPFPLSAWDVGPEEFDTVLEKGRVEKEGLVVDYEGEFKDFKGFKAVNVSFSRLEGARNSYYVVTRERPHMLLEMSTDQGYHIELES